MNSIQKKRNNRDSVGKKDIVSNPSPSPSPNPSPTPKNEVKDMNDKISSDKGLNDKDLADGMHRTDIADFQWHKKTIMKSKKPIKRRNSFISHEERPSVGEKVINR